MDELRAKIGAQCGPSGGKQRYAGEAGKGPEGKTCGDCGWLTFTDRATSGKYPKCGLTNYTSGDATTIKRKTPACQHFADEKQVPHRFRPSSGENRYKQYTEKD